MRSFQKARQNENLKFGLNRLKSQIQNDFLSNIGRIIDRIRQKLVHSANRNLSFMIRWVITSPSKLPNFENLKLSNFFKFWNRVGFVEFDECSKNNFLKLFLIDDPKNDYLEMNRLNKLLIYFLKIFIFSKFPKNNMSSNFWHCDVDDLKL